MSVTTIANVGCVYTMRTHTILSQLIMYLLQLSKTDLNIFEVVCKLRTEMWHRKKSRQFGGKQTLIKIQAQLLTNKLPVDKYLSK